MSEPAIRGYDVFCYQNGEPVDYVVNPLGNKQPLPKTVVAARALTEDVVAAASGELEWISETRALATYRTDGEVTSVDEIRIEPIGYDDATYADLPDAAIDDLDKGRTYRVLCTPKDGDPFDVLDKYQDRDGDTLIFRSHRINLNVMQDVQISAYRRGEE